MKNILYILITGIVLSTLNACLDASDIRDRAALTEKSMTVYKKVETPSNLGIVVPLAITEFKKAIEENKGPLVDVRTKEEYDEGHIEGAVNIDFKKKTFPSYISAISKENAVLIYSQTGNRSEKSVLIMQALGFDEIYDLSNGFKEWKAENMPIAMTNNQANEALYVKLKAATPIAQTKANLGSGVSKDIDHFEQMISEGNITLVDIRTQKEYIEGHIEGAINIDWENRHFSKNIIAVSNDQPVAIYCRSGNKSSRAMFALQAIGFKEIINLDKGFKSWEDANKKIKTFEVKGDIRHLDVENFNNAISRNAGTLIDVRTPREYKASHIVGAINIDYNDANFEAEYSKLDKSIPVIIYCRSGARSNRAMKKLTRAGFKVYNLNKGFLDWKSNGMKVDGNNANAKDQGEEGC